jgi:hypothetical protein
MTKGRVVRRRYRPACEESPAQEAARRIGIAHFKKGEVSELAFLYKAASLGFALSLPYGSQFYDFVVDGGGNLWRVQVKSATAKLRGLYNVGIRHSTEHRAKAYAESEIDFAAVHIIPEDTWYILPVREVLERQTLLFRPKGYPRPDPYAYYREAWHLLREPDGLTFG